MQANTRYIIYLYIGIASLFLKKEEILSRHWVLLSLWI